jgi:hypothetical protein
MEALDAHGDQQHWGYWLKPYADIDGSASRAEACFALLSRRAISKPARRHCRHPLRR